MTRMAHHHRARARGRGRRFETPAQPLSDPNGLKPEKPSLVSNPADRPPVRSRSRGRLTIRAFARRSAAKDRPGAVGRIAQPERGRASPRFANAAKSTRPYARENVNVLMSVHEGRRSAEGALEGVELALDLGRALPLREAAGRKRRRISPPKGGQPPRRRERRHRTERRAGREIEMQPDSDPPASARRPGARSGHRPQVRHDARRRNPARRANLEDAAADALGEAVIVGAEHDRRHVVPPRSGSRVHPSALEYRSAAPLYARQTLKPLARVPETRPIQLSVVVPVYNEGADIAPLCARLVGGAEPHHARLGDPVRR